MAAVDSALKAQTLGFIRQGFNVARQRVIGLVAVHVNQQAALGSQLAQQFDADRTVRHGAFKVRYATHHIHAHVKGAFKLVQPAGRPQHAILRKSHQLQVNVGGNHAFDLQHGLNWQHAGVTGVHMAANGQQPFGYSPVAVGKAALDQCISRQQWLEFTPQCNAFKQGAAFIDTGQAVAQGGVHVKVRVYKRRGEQVAARINRLGCLRASDWAFSDLRDLAVFYGHRHASATIGQGSVGN